MLRMEKRKVGKKRNPREMGRNWGGVKIQHVFPYYRKITKTKYCPTEK
jgi:hypothetical protein